VERPPTTYTPDRLAELLDAWRRPGGVLAPDELRALLAWSGTTAEDRESLQEALAVTQQQVEAKPLAPQQRRGHVSWLDRIRSLFRR
jgi:hypothetical protein